MFLPVRIDTVTNRKTKYGSFMTILQKRNISCLVKKMYGFGMNKIVYVIIFSRALQKFEAICMLKVHVTVNSSKEY